MPSGPIWMPLWTTKCCPVSDDADELLPVLLDTCVLIDLGYTLDPAGLPDAALHISAITLAELAAGVNATTDTAEHAARLRRLQWAEHAFDPVPFSAAAARCYGHVFALVRAAGRQPRSRMADLFIASIAVANGWTLLTRNPTDFEGLDPLLSVTAV